MIPGLVPLLNGVEFRSIQKGYPHGIVTVSKVAKTDLVDISDRKGWIWHMVCGANDPYLTVEIEIDGYKDSFNFYNLYAGGITVPNNQTWYLRKYDPANNLYVAAYTPSLWWPIRTKYYVKAILGTASPNDTAMVLGARFDLLWVTSEIELRKSIRDVFGIEELAKLMPALVRRF